MSYGIIRAQKISSFAGLAGVSAHNTREREVPNADPEKSKQNAMLVGKNTEEILSRTRQLLDTVDRKIRKGAVIAIEYMVTSSPDFDNPDYLQKAIEFVEKKHGKENVVCKSIHLDEHTPHAHIVVVPLVRKEKKVTNPVTKESKMTQVTSLCAKDFMNGPKKLRELQDDFYNDVSKNFGLERGEIGSKAKHTDISRWYAVKHKEEAEGRLVPIGHKIGPRIDLPEEIEPLHTIHKKSAEISKFSRDQVMFIYDGIVSDLPHKAPSKKIRTEIMKLAEIKAEDTPRQILEKSAMIEQLALNRHNLDVVNTNEFKAEVAKIADSYEKSLEITYEQRDIHLEQTKSNSLEAQKPVQRTKDYDRGM